MLNRTFRSSTPLVLGALCGLLGERTGIVNIGIEGQLLMSAFTGFYTAAATGSIWVGVLAGVVSGAVLGLFLALCAVTWKVDQIIAGTVINIFVAGITSFLYTQGKQSPGGLDQIEIPLLSKIPLIGDVLFTNTPIAYMAIILVFVLHFALFRTRWGLRSRSVGEHPSAADTVGISVGRAALPQRRPRRRPGRPRRRVPQPRGRRHVRARDERPAGLHGAGDHDLRALEADPRLVRRAVLRLHQRRWPPSCSSTRSSTSRRSSSTSCPTSS